MARYHGRRGVVYMSATGSGNAVPVLGLSNWSLDMGTDTVEVTALGDTNKQYVQGLKDISGTISGFWDDTEDGPFVAADSPDGTKFYLYQSSNAASKYFYGPAWVDASISTGVGEAVAISLNFVANGAWGRK